MASYSPRFDGKLRFSPRALCVTQNNLRINTICISSPFNLSIISRFEFNSETRAPLYVQHNEKFNRISRAITVSMQIKRG